MTRSASTTRSSTADPLGRVKHAAVAHEAAFRASSISPPVVFSTQLSRNFTELAPIRTDPAAQMKVNVRPDPRSVPDLENRITTRLGLDDHAGGKPNPVADADGE